MSDIHAQLEGLYFYSFTSGSYDCYSFDGMYVSRQFISEIAWDNHLSDWKAERDRLSSAVPLKEVKFGDRPRLVRDTESQEAAILRTYLIGGPEQDFIEKYGLVHVEETQDFHRD